MLFDASGDFFGRMYGGAVQCAPCELCVVCGVVEMTDTVDG